jgi:hypothetical protein
MRRADVAEWILSLGTSRERAASITGDLTEEVGARGAVWFWSAVARTTAAQVWRDVVGDRKAMMKFAYHGLRLQVVALILAGLLGIGIMIPIVGLEVGIGAVTGSAFPPALATSIQVWVMVGVALFANFHAGRWLAMLAPGREFPAVVSLIVVELVISGTVSLVAAGSGAWWGLAPNAASNVASLLPLIAGAAVIRRRQLVRRSV